MTHQNMQNFSNKMQMNRHLLYFSQAEKRSKLFLIFYSTQLFLFHSFAFFILIFYSMHSARNGT